MTARIPDNFNARPMGYPRWLLLTVNQGGKPNGGLAGMLDGRYISEARAKGITQLVSDALFAPLVMVKEHRGAKRNPTLVHHGKAKAAKFHVLTAGPHATAIADLYTMGAQAAAKLTEDLATTLGVPLLLLSNAQLQARLEDHQLLRSRTGSVEFRPSSRNPQRRPVKGETWTSPYRGTVTIVDTNPNGRVQVRFQNGNREWIDRLDFAGEFKPGRDTTRNPKRRSLLNAVSVAAGMGYPYIRGHGRPDPSEQYWLVRFTRTSDGKGPAVFVGFGARGKVIVEHENPRPTTNPKHRTVAAESLEVGDIVRPPAREVSLWMARTAREKGMDPDNLGIMLTDIHEGAPDKTGRWLVFSGFLPAEWYKDGRELKFTFKARPHTPWAVIARPATNPSRTAHARGQRKRLRALGSRKTYRASAAAFRELRATGARPGLAARTIYYHERSKARTASRGRKRTKSNPRGKRFSVRKIEDWVGGQGYTQAVFEVVDSSDGRVVFRSYNQHDARVESAHRNKFGPEGNPTVKVSGTLRVRRVRRGRPPLSIVRKPRAARAPRAPRASSAARLETGEPVTVPYSGRSSYFGHKVKRQTEPAKVMGYVDSSTGGELVQVSVRRGKGATVHEFPAHLVRRRPRRDYRSEGEKHPEVRTRLEASVGGDIAKGLHLLELAHAESDAAEKMARAMQPGEPDFARARRAMTTTARRAQALETIVGRLQESQPGYVDPFAVANRRRPRLSRGRRNPRGSELERGKKTFRKWHEFDSHKVTKVRGPGRVIPKTLVALGTLRSVVYESTKYTGKPTLYEHKTKRPHPVLASDPDGRHVHIVGGRMRITGDGLVN